MKRNNAFDLLCGICILRMVTLHVICQTAFRQADWWKMIMEWSFFFMSFFFFKAGYFNKGVEGESRAFCLDKFRRLMTPYFTWGAISFLINGAFLLLFPDRLPKAIASLQKFRWLVGGLTVGNSPLWFLLCFFAAYIIVHFYLKMTGNRKWAYLGLMLFPIISYRLFLLGNPLYFMTSNVFCGVYFFALGRVWHKVLRYLGQRKGFVLSTILALAFCVVNIYFHAEYEMRTNDWQGLPLLVMASTTLALLGLSGILLTLRTPRIPFISYVGEHSMVYYVSHYPIILSYAYTSIVMGHSIKKSYIDLAVILVLVFVLCTLMVPVVERVKWLSGRFPKKTRQ